MHNIVRVMNIHNALSNRNERHVRMIRRFADDIRLENLE